MALRRWGQPSPHNAPFRLAVSEAFMLLSLASDTSLVSSSGCLSLPSILFSVSFLFLSLFLFSLSLPVCLSLFSFHFVSLLGSSLSSSQMSCSSLLLFLLWNARSQPDGSSHKFQAACHTFWLGNRKRMHAWPTQQPLPPASGHAAAGKKILL